MELYDEQVEQNKSKTPIIIGIIIAILIVITIIIICGILYLKSLVTTVKIDGQRNLQIEELFYLETTEQGIQLYMPIIKMSKIFGYEGFTGDYKEKSEDNTKCHVIGKDEIVMFTKDSNVLVKIPGNYDTEYITLDKAVFEKNGELYTTVEGVQKAFNVLFAHDDNYKNIQIYSMDYLIKEYAKNLKSGKYSDDFIDKKAILEGMMIVEENSRYGVIDVTSNKAVLQSKYEDISYLPATSEFLVKSNGKYGVMSKEAKTTIKTIYDEIKTLDNQKGLYLVKQNGVYGVINTVGDVLIELEYKQIGISIDKYAQNGVENKYILLDEIIPVQNNEGLWAFFSIKGEKITDFKYTEMGCQSSPANNSYPVLVVPSYKVIVVKKEKKYNLVTSTGEELLPGYILDSVYLKTDIETGQNKFYMTSNNNTKVIEVEKWLESIGR